jgi:multicomponent Na+:H+ antiporter subunit F
MDEIFTYFCFLVASCALILSIVRIVRGPSVAERALAFDVMSAVCIAFFILFARKFQVAWPLDGVMLLCFLSFLGTLAVVYYVEEVKKP